MAPKVASGGWFVRHEPASYPNGPKPMTKCEGEKSKRRDVPGRVDRWIKTHMSHVNKILLRTSLVDGLRVEQQLHNDILSLADNGRLSCRYRDALLTKYAFEMKSSKHGSFKVKDHKMAVNTELMRTVALACHKDNKIRDSSGLEAYWRQATSLNQRDCCLILF